MPVYAEKHAMCTASSIRLVPLIEVPPPAEVPDGLRKQCTPGTCWGQVWGHAPPLNPPMNSVQVNV